MSLTTCDKCGGNIPLGPHASNLCESCGRALFSVEKIHGYEGEGGTVGWCPHCGGRGKTGPTPDSAVPCDDCGGNGKWKFPPCNVAMAELRDKFGHLFSAKDEP